jgi:hypothetical protein
MNLTSKRGEKIVYCVRIGKQNRGNEEYTIQIVSGYVLYPIFCPHLKQFTSPWRFLGHLLLLATVQIPFSQTCNVLSGDML